MGLTGIKHRVEVTDQQHFGFVVGRAGRPGNGKGMVVEQQRLVVQTRALKRLRQIPGYIQASRVCGEYAKGDLEHIDRRGPFGNLRQHLQCSRFVCVKTQSLFSGKASLFIEALTLVNPAQSDGGGGTNTVGKFFIPRNGL